MAREINRLSARRIQALKDPGRHGDGGGLYLVIDANGSKRWALIFQQAGRRREMGLGSYLTVSLARARELAVEIRSQLGEGLDPIEARRTPHSEAAHPTKTFGDLAAAYMDDRDGLWKNAKMKYQWRQTLEVQAAELWRMPVADVDTEAVLKVLRPLWLVKSETAKRIRGRVERILDAARVGPQPWRRLGPNCGVPRPDHRHGHAD